MAKVAADAFGRHLANGLRHLAAHILQQRYCESVRKGHVELPGDETQYGRRQVADDRIFDAVEIRPLLFPVIRISCYLDPFVRFEFDEFEGTGADRMAAHVARRYVAGSRPANTRRREMSERRAAAASSG